ncbi:MAG: hypothetical protein MJZ37_00595 [Bacilli bacterium]|nr:hypothetical protein [Bacilli bacterium]
MDTGRVIGALSYCTTRESIADTFDKFEVKELSQKIEYLNQCMGADETFFSGGDELNEEVKYELTLQMFELGEWR